MNEKVKVTENRVIEYKPFYDSLEYVNSLASFLSTTENVNLLAATIKNDKVFQLSIGLNYIGENEATTQFLVGILIGEHNKEYSLNLAGKRKNLLKQANEELLMRGVQEKIYKDQMQSRPETIDSLFGPVDFGFLDIYKEEDTNYVCENGHPCKDECPNCKTEEKVDNKETAPVKTFTDALKRITNKYKK
jgi:hypothetical protein